MAPAFTVPTILANNISLSYGTYQDTISISDRNVELDPTGITLYSQFDLTPETSINVNYGEYNDSSRFNNASTIALDTNSWGLGISHSWQAWLFSLDYGYTEEDISIENNSRDISFYHQTYHAPSWLVSVAYGDFIGNTSRPWYWSVAGNIQYADWERDIERVTQPINDPEINTGKDAGDSWFASIGLSLSQFLSTTEDTGILYGGSLSWHHLIDGESGVVSRNGRSISQISRNNSQFNQSNFSQNIDGEQYGLATLFVGYNINQQFSVEIDLSTSIAADTNSNSANISTNYQF